MEISRKKILIGVIVIFCLFLLMVLGAELKKVAEQKQEEQKQETMSSEQKKIKTIQECIKEVKEMDFSKLIDITEQLSKDLAFREKIKIYSYPLYLLRRHLRCQFLQAQSKEEEEKIVDSAMEAQRRIVYPNLEELWEKIKPIERENFIHPEEAFLFNLAFGNVSEICPDKLPLLCKRNNGVFFQESDEWCNHICQTLAQYEKDKDKLEKEVINFKDWKIKGLYSRPFTWRLAVAYRFGGKEAALKVCDNAPDEKQKNSCLNSLMIYESKNWSCEESFDRLTQLICDYQLENY